MRNAIAAIVLSAGLLVSCDNMQPPQPKSASGVTKANAVVEVNPSTGLTIEQENVKRRLENDNKPGQIKHLYIISPLSGDVLIYSTVKGKVTSGDKRLTPKTVTSQDGQYTAGDFGGARVVIGDRWYRTSEVIQDDGTYGDSSDYIFWFGVDGVYRQISTEGVLWIVSDQPLAVGRAKIVIGKE